MTQDFIKLLDEQRPTDPEHALRKLIPSCLTLLFGPMLDEDGDHIFGVDMVDNVLLTFLE